MQIFMLWSTFESTFLRRRLPNVTWLARPLLANNLSNILPERTPLFAVLVSPTSSMAAVSKALPICHRKVTGVTQKLVSAGNHKR